MKPEAAYIINLSGFLLGRITIFAIDQRQCTGISNWGATNSFEGNHIYGVDVSGGPGWVPAGTPGPVFRPSNFSRVDLC
eukprot:COSAG05_NODE_149_length_16213_cov_66.750279_14_plen_79_part_00